MNIIQKSLVNSADIVAQYLTKGLVCVLPSDTVYGLFAIADVKGAPPLHTAAKIAQIKDRNQRQKPFIHLIASPDDIKKYSLIELPKKLLSLWPGALTIIVPVKKQVLSDCTQDTVAFRCPNDAWLCSIIQKCLSPVYSTSANITGHPICTCLEQLVDTFKNTVPLIVDDGNKEGNLPSTIVKVSCKKIEVIRQGSVKVPFDTF